MNEELGEVGYGRHVAYVRAGEPGTDGDTEEGASIDR